MKTVAGLLMIANAAIFFFGGVQHVGITVGRFTEPLIIPAAIVEVVCGLCLLWGAIALFRSSRTRLALITNLIALGGVLLDSPHWLSVLVLALRATIVPSYDADPDRRRDSHPLLR